jgi:apolipoprotein N-acyltransferase
MPSIARPSRGKRSGSRSRKELALAALSGGLLGTAFLPLPLGFIAWCALVPLLAALESRVRARASVRQLFGLGYVFGLVFYLIGTHWIALLSDVAITVPWLKYPAWALAAAYLACFSGVAAGLAGWLTQRARRSLAFTFPLAMLGVEELRGSGELGFPWFQPGYTQHAYAPVIQLASLGSVTLVTLWVLVVNVLVWRALAGRNRMRSATGAALALLFPWVWGQRALEAAPREPGPQVALVQGNVAGEIKWSGKHEREILATFLSLSDSAARGNPRPVLVIWPETATGSYLRKQVDQALAVARFTARARVPVFTGYADFAYGPDGRPRVYNAAGVFAPDGAEGPMYAKRHLVPFGERMPFEWLVPGLAKLDLGQAEWVPGRGTVLFPSEAGPFACLICFESIFPELARADVQSGARWLVNVTNDEWFGNGAALVQHAAMANFRAVEHHVPLARCANTGLTELIDANGRVTRRLPVFVPGVLEGRLSQAGPPTLYTRIGDWPGLACALALVLLAVEAFAGPAFGARFRS